MLLAIYISIILILGVVFVQDLMYRGVTWYLFPILLIGLLSVRLLSGESITSIGQSSLVNFVIVLMVLLVLTLYLFLRNGRIVNMTKDHLGIGDIVFLGVVACYLSVLNFLLFFNVSLVCTVLLYLLLKGITRSRFIPLAGFQSLVFILFLVGDRWYYHFHITDDAWLLRLYYPWA